MLHHWFNQGTPIHQEALNLPLSVLLANDLFFIPARVSQTVHRQIQAVVSLESGFSTVRMSWLWKSISHYPCPREKWGRGRRLAFVAVAGGGRRGRKWGYWGKTTVSTSEDSVGQGGREAEAITAAAPSFYIES